MDYEKKYNEALERVRRLHDRMLVLSSTDALVASAELEFIFPELAESDDERILRVISEAVITFFSDYANDYEDEDRDAALAWLEKQKEKSEIPIMDGENVKSNQEWSEEDEDNLHRVIRVLEDNDSDWKELSDWLKSLCPSWKPSEEQMEALNALNCHGDLSYIGQQNQLISLYNDLKKLM